MSANFVTATGFIKKTLAQIKSELEISFQSIFGSNIDLDPTGPTGQLIGILAKREADLWDGSEEIYTSRNPNEASGTSLDNVAADTGVTRKAATPTIVYNVLLYGTEGTIIPAGKQIKAENNSLTFNLLSQVEISVDFCRYATLLPDAPTDSTVYSITLGGTEYTDTWHTGDEPILAFLKAMLSAWTGTVSDDGTNLILLSAVDFSLVYTSTVTLVSWASGGDFECDFNGANPVPANTLTQFVTPVSGWDSVNNLSPGVTGLEQETDAAFRLRRINSYLSSSATDEKIISALLNDISGVISANVISNRTMIETIDGNPPKSFEAVVLGGTDADIAALLWITMPSGIESYGNVTVPIVDSHGNPQDISFSRPANKYIHVRVSRDKYSEEIYPADGDTAIKTAIVAWAEANFIPGKDVIYQRISIPIYSVAGIGDILIEVGATDVISDPPSYDSADIAIAVREIAVFDESIITVQDL